MASTIITKNSSTASAIPAVGDLTKGELAVNVTDKKVYTKDNSAAIVKIVGSLGNQEANAVAITGGSIAGITDLAVADGGTGASTASDARTNLGLGTIATQAASSVTITGGSVTGITDITVADGGTGASTAANARSNLGAAASGANSDITSLSGLTTALSVAQGGTGITSLGTGVATFLGTPSSANLASAISDETGSGALVFANSPTLVTPALGTPSALVGTNITGTASGLTAGNVTTNANLTGAVTSVGNATSLGSFSSANLLGALTDETGTGSAVFATSPTLVTPILGTPTSATLTNATGLPISTGVSGLGTGVATFLATPSSANLAAALTDETGSGANVFATSPTLVTPILGTPTSATLTNATGLPLTTGVTGTLPTANGGTNLTSFTSGGVVYASSSSALATGSALTFDGTSLGVGSSSYGDAGTITTSIGVAGTTSGGLQLWASSAQEHFIQWGDATSGAATYAGAISYSHASDFMRFWTASTEGMRLTSTGLGIGTSSPAQKLHLNVSSGNVYEQISSGSNNVYVGFDSSRTVGTIQSNNALTFDVGSSYTERMRLDSAGNLGLGVTPSAWVEGVGLNVGSGRGGSIFTETINYGFTTFNANAFYSATNTWKYVTSNAASRYQQLNGVHSWYNAASGTAGNAISFTQAMTLDASGNLVIGNTSASARLHIDSGSTALMSVFNSTNANGGYFTGYSSSTAVWDIGTAKQTLSVGASTDFGINVRSGFLALGTGNTERARIDSSGNLLVGTTSSLPSFANGRIEAAAAASSYGLVLDATASSASGIGIRGNDSTTALSFFNAQSGATVGSIVINSATTSYNVTSDQRLKENIQDADSASSLIDSLQVRKFDWKVNGLHQPYGFIAQELVTVSPEAVYQPADTEEMMAVDYSKLVPMLVKEIQSLRQRLSAANI